MFDHLIAFVGGLRRIAAETRACRKALERIADTLEAQQAPTGVSLRTHYRDGRPGAVDDAALFAQSDAEMARLERLEREAERAGRGVALDDDLDEVRTR